MRSIPLVASALALLSPAVLAGDLDVRVESGGSTSISVQPGALVKYQVVGELTDLLNEGLAAVRFDLSFDGGSLPQADAPTAGNMLNFTGPLGLSNPAGFGGTQVGGDLIQIGGAQNTFNNTLPSTNLTGSVQTGVAWLGSPEVLVSGNFTAPMIAGSYTLSVSNLAANVIQQGETGIPHWAVEEAGNGLVTGLSVQVVETFSGDVGSLSLSAGGTQNWSLDAGAAQGGRAYWVFGSLSGTGSFPVGSVVLPLTLPDIWFNYTITHPNQLPLVNSLGFLNGSGQASGAFTIPGGTNPALAGMTVHHAYLLGPTIDFSSNPVALTFIP